MKTQHLSLAQKSEQDFKTADKNFSQMPQARGSPEENNGYIELNSKKADIEKKEVNSVCLSESGLRANDKRHQAIETQIHSKSQSSSSNVCTNEESTQKLSKNLEKKTPGLKNMESGCQVGHSHGKHNNVGTNETEASERKTDNSSFQLYDDTANEKIMKCLDLIQKQQMELLRLQTEQLKLRKSSHPPSNGSAVDIIKATMDVQQNINELQENLKNMMSTSDSESVSKTKQSKNYNLMGIPTPGDIFKAPAAVQSKNPTIGKEIPAEDAGALSSMQDIATVAETPSLSSKDWSLDTSFAPPLVSTAVKNNPAVYTPLKLPLMFTPAIVQHSKPEQDCNNQKPAAKTILQPPKFEIPSVLVTPSAKRHTKFTQPPIITPLAMRNASLIHSKNMNRHISGTGVLEVGTAQEASPLFPNSGQKVRRVKNSKVMFEDTINLSSVLPSPSVGLWTLANNLHVFEQPQKESNDSNQVCSSSPGMVSYV